MNDLTCPPEVSWLVSTSLGSLGVVLPTDHLGHKEGIGWQIKQHDE